MQGGEQVHFKGSLASTAFGLTAGANQFLSVGRRTAEPEAQAPENGFTKSPV